MHESGPGAHGSAAHVNENPAPPCDCTQTSPGLQVVLPQVTGGGVGHSPVSAQVPPLQLALICAAEPGHAYVHALGVEHTSQPEPAAGASAGHISGGAAQPVGSATQPEVSHW